MRSRRTAALIGSLTLSLLAAACGSGDDDADSQVASLGTTTTTAAADGSATDATTPTSVDPEDAFLAFAQCMRDHGVDMPDPQVDSSGRGSVIIGAPGGDGEEMPDRDVVEAAQTECQPLIDNAVGNAAQQLDPEEVQRMQEEALAFAQCMREHGIDMPDPTFGEGGGMTVNLGGPDSDSGIDPTSQEFQDAQTACAGDGGFIGAGKGPVTGTNGSKS